jgi:hypothetical protein
MLFIADGTLEPSSPPIVTNNRVGLPEPWHPDSTDADVIRNVPTTPAPAPDMESDLVRAAMPKAQSAPEDDLVNPAARAARAEAPPEKKRVTRTQPPVEYRQNNTGSHSPGGREFGLSGTN